MTPTIDLAKLALVTSRDEEEDEADKCGTDSSNDTDATLVDDAPSRLPVSETRPSSPRSPSQASGSTVLGKRSRDLKRQRSSMDIDSPPPLEAIDSSVPSSPRRLSMSAPEASSSRIPDASTSTAVDRDGDVEMPAASVSTKRASAPARKTEVSDSVMMFGKPIPCCQQLLWLTMADLQSFRETA